jgi:hypothetical protein
MKKFFGGVSTFLVLIVLLVSGCATQSVQQSSRAKYRESAFTDVVIHFHAWDSILVLRPDVREAGYLRQYDRNEVIKLLQSDRVKGDLVAVVVTEAYLLGDHFTALASEWQALLQECGFQRVVFLRAGMGSEINGLAILHDSGVRSGITSS